MRPRVDHSEPMEDWRRMLLDSYASVGTPPRTWIIRKTGLTEYAVRTAFTGRSAPQAEALEKILTVLIPGDAERRDEILAAFHRHPAPTDPAAAAVAALDRITAAIDRQTKVIADLVTLLTGK